MDAARLYMKAQWLHEVLQAAHQSIGVVLVHGFDLRLKLTRLFYIECFTTCFCTVYTLQAVHTCAALNYCLANHVRLVALKLIKRCMRNPRIDTPHV